MTTSFNWTNDTLARLGMRKGPTGEPLIPIPEYANIGADTVGRHANGERADAIALLIEDEANKTTSYTFSELDTAAASLAAGLAKIGVKRGDPVGVHSGQTLETALSHLAIYRLGAVVVTLSQLYGSETIKHALTDCSARFVITEASLWEPLEKELADLPQTLVPIWIGDKPIKDGHAFEQLVTTNPSSAPKVETKGTDPALLMYTSGSTGLPKGLLHGHRVLHAYMPTVRLFYNMEMDEPTPTGERLVFWTPADWAWVGGLLDLVLPAWFAGHTVVASRARFDAEWALGFMSRHHVTHSFMTPTALKRLAEVPKPKDRWPLALRVICTGGESLPGEVVRWCESDLGVTCNEFYGLTEFNHLVGNCRALYPVRQGSMGRAYPGHRTTIVNEEGQEVPPGEVGEIVAAADDPTLFLGYWGENGPPKRLLLGAWLRTRDLAYQDDDGWYWYQGRNDDLIKSAGYRIGPAEVEDALLRHPAVAEAAVVGSPDPDRGTVVKAFVRLAEGYKPSDETAIELQNFVKNTLALYKYPRKIEFVEEFPLTSSGKIQRGELRRRELAESAGA